MDASGLFVALSGGESGREFIECHGVGCEEAEGIEVRAGDRAGGNEGVDLSLRKPERG